MVPTMAKPSMVTGVRGASETSSTARRPVSQASCRGERRHLSRAAHQRARGGSRRGRKGSWQWRCGVEQAGSVSCSSRGHRGTRRPPGAARCSLTAAWSSMQQRSSSSLWRRQGVVGAMVLGSSARVEEAGMSGLGVDDDLSSVRTFPTTRAPVSCIQRSMVASALTTSPRSGTALHKGERWGASDLLGGALPHGHRRRCEQRRPRLQGLLLLLLFLLPLSFPSLFQSAGGRGFGETNPQGGGSARDRSGWGTDGSYRRRRTRRKGEFAPWPSMAPEPWQRRGCNPVARA
jgi:hypothetical protein